MKQTNRYIKEVHLLHSIEVQTHSFTPILPCTKSHILQTISTSQNHTNQIQKHQSFSQFQNLKSIISCKTKHSHSNFHSESMKFIYTPKFVHFFIKKYQNPIRNLIEQTWQGIVITQNLKMLAVSRRSAIGRHDAVKRPVLASEPR